MSTTASAYTAATAAVPHPTRAFTAADPVLVIGAGIMGSGIAQVAAQAGHTVFLFDLREGAAREARTRLGATLDALVAKGRLAAADAAATLGRIEPVATLGAAASARLAVEAIVEQLDAKRSLCRQLEAVLADDAVLATNTSSISVTAIANGLARPERLVGMHFFNPVPLMALVEVVHGLRTAPDVAEAIAALATAWGKVPVHAKSTPGFIVNRIARPFYAETLALLHEQAAAPEVLDACLRAAGFRMGPCELMDLIGHDTNFAVTNSVYEANFFDKRYAPSPVQRELVDGGLLGRKTGRGFYAHPAGAPALPPLQTAALARPAALTVHGAGPAADALAESLAAAIDAEPALRGLVPQRDASSGWTGLAVDAARLALTDGRPAHVRARRDGVADLAVFDRPLAWPAARRPANAPRPVLAIALAPPSRGAAPAGPVAGGVASTAAGSADSTALAGSAVPAASTGPATWAAQAPAWLAALGFHPVTVADAPGLVVARTLAMLINEAADAVLQGVCTPDGADEAMKRGVNYPAGPFEWLAGWGVHGVLDVIDALDATYRGERYRASPWLQRRA